MLSVSLFACLCFRSFRSCFSFRLCVFFALFYLDSAFSLLCFFFVMYAIVFAPCSGNAERQKQHSGQSIAERRQGNAFAGLILLAFCICYRCIIYHYARTYAAGVYRPAPGGTFLVRMDEGKEPNRSCSSPSSLVPRQKTNSWQRDNYRMGIFMTKTLQEYNPQLSCSLLLDYRH